MSGGFGRAEAMPRSFCAHLVLDQGCEEIRISRIVAAFHLRDSTDIRDMRHSWGKARGMGGAWGTSSTSSRGMRSMESMKDVMEVGTGASSSTCQHDGRGRAAAEFTLSHANIPAPGAFHSTSSGPKLASTAFWNTSRRWR